MVLGHDINKNRTQDVHLNVEVSFESMMLKKNTFRGLEKAGFIRPSPVQLQGIPVGICGFDLLIEAKSGTGKTAVFTVIALQKLDLKQGLQAIILAPTREIASQISDVIVEIGSKYKNLNVAVVMGGLPFKDDIAKFQENVHIVVGSPGRLRHLIQANHIDVSSVRLFVLDEADKLMEGSFLADINYIFSCLPSQKQVIMSSATYSDEAKQFINKYVRNVVHICPDSNCVLLGIAQKVVTVPHNTNIVKQTKHRYQELKKILNETQFKQCLIFCNYQVRVSEVHRMLCRDKWPSEQLYGQQKQTDRLDALKTLQEYKCRILVSTDLAARGIDASNVDIVINFEPPYEWETYLHRIGRAGRYGSYGTAITILSEGKETAKFKESLSLTKIPFELQNLWNDKPFNITAEENTCNSDKDEVDPLIMPANNATVENDNQLWETLTSATKDDDIEILSFQDICNSSQETGKLKIKSFTDLLDSFSTNNNNVTKNQDKSEYKHLKAAKIMKKNRRINYKTYFSSDDENETYLTESMEKDTINLCNLTMTSGIIKANGKVKNDHTTTSEEEEENEKSVANKSHSTKYFKFHNHNVKSQDGNSHVTGVDSVEQALMDAGLPTAFGKKKNIRKHNRFNRFNQTESSFRISETEIPHHSETDDFEENVHECETNPLNDQRFNETKLAAADTGLNIGLERDNINPKNKTKQSNNDENNVESYVKPISRKHHNNQQVNTAETSKMSSSKHKDKFKGKFHKQSIASIEESNSSESFNCETKPSAPIHGYHTHKNISNDTINYQQPKTKKLSRSVEEYKRGKQFDLWYKQLKLQTQTIQQTLYLETLRNL